jgi:Tol biopolymer transport system component
MSADGSNSKEIMSIETNNTIALDLIAPSWSPDSQRIVFSKPNPDESKVVLWIMNKDGSGLEQITF